MSLLLAGLTVLNTRPATQAAALTALLQAQGANVLELPLLAIAPVADAELAQKAGSHPADLAIVTSANAVRTAQGLGLAWPDKVFALGSGTAKALAEVGVPATALAGGSSEALLQHPQLQAVQGQSLLLVTGEGGRELLAPALRARGAVVRVAAVYQRLAVSHTLQRLEQTLAAANVAIITSGEALATLFSSTAGAARTSLRSLPLLLPSERVAEQASALGLAGERLVPTVMSDAAMVARLCAWAQR